MESEYMKGLCTDMCPKNECSLRKKNNLLHSLENNGILVKEFSRSAAGRRQQTSSDLRTSETLLKTMKYLIKEVLFKNKINFIVYEFINDRIQAIRQDLTIQNIEDENAVWIIEEAIAFYIKFNVLLQDKKLSEFDPVLNHQQISVCFQKLLRLYEVVDQNESNRNKFFAIYAIYNLDNSETLTKMIKFKQECNSNLIVVFDLYFAFTNHHFINFFKIYSKLDTLLQLSCFRHLRALRLNALKVISVAYSSKTLKFPFKVLCDWLYLDKDDAKCLCENCSLKIIDDHVQFTKLSNIAPNERVLFLSEVYLLQQQINESFV